jgi:hypothetical protein
VILFSLFFLRYKSREIAFLAINQNKIGHKNEIGHKIKGRTSVLRRTVNAQGQVLTWSLQEAKG